MTRKLLTPFELLVSIVGIVGLPLALLERSDWAATAIVMVAWVSLVVVYCAQSYVSPRRATKEQSAVLTVFFAATYGFLFFPLFGILALTFAMSDGATLAHDYMVEQAEERFVDPGTTAAKGLRSVMTEMPEAMYGIVQSTPTIGIFSEAHKKGVLIPLEEAFRQIPRVFLQAIKDHFLLTEFLAVLLFVVSLMVAVMAAPGAKIDGR